MSGDQLGFDLAAGAAARDRGLSLVESRDRSLAEILRDEARRIARTAGTVTIDDVRDFADEHGFAAPHKNFWGCIFRGDEWIAVGSEPSGRVGKHAHRNTVWRLR